MFVIDGRGIESWYPVDEKVGPSECGGKFMGLATYQFRARSNWHRGSYYMDHWIGRIASREDVRYLRNCAKRVKRGILSGEDFQERVKVILRP